MAVSSSAIVSCGTHNFSGLFSVDHRVNPAPQIAVMMIHTAIVLRGMLPILRPITLKNDPIADSILLPVVSMQDVIVIFQVLLYKKFKFAQREEQYVEKQNTGLLEKVNLLFNVQRTEKDPGYEYTYLICGKNEKEEIRK